MMKTLKKIQHALLILGCIILGATQMNAQQSGNSVDEVEELTSAIKKTFAEHITVGNTLANVNINPIPVLEDLDPYYFYAGIDVSICNGESYTLSGINTSMVKAMWGTQGDGEFDNPYSLDANYTPGTYDLKEGKVTLVLYSIDPDGIYPYMITDSMILTLSDICGEPTDYPKD